MKAVNSRSVILNVAARLFAKRGYDSVSVRDIARAAKIRTPTIYHFFGSKRGLFEEAVLDRFAQVARSMQEGFDKGGTAEEQLRRFIQCELDAFSNDKIFFRLLQRHLLSEDDKLSKVLTQSILSPVHERVRGFLNELGLGAGNGVIPWMIPSILIGFVAMSAFRHYLPSYGPAVVNSALETRALLDKIMNLILMEAGGFAAPDQDRFANPGSPVRPVELEFPRASQISVASK